MSFIWYVPHDTVHILYSVVTGSQKTCQGCLHHFLFEQTACVVFLLEDVSCHGLWNIRDAAEEMSVSFQALRKCWLGFIDTSASSSLSGTSCHRHSVSCSECRRRLSWGSIFMEWYCYMWLNLHFTLHFWTKTFSFHVAQLCH